MKKVGQFILTLFIIAAIAGGVYVFGRQAGIFTASKNQTKQSVSITALLLKDNEEYFLAGDTRFKEPVTIVNSYDKKTKALLSDLVDKKVVVQGTIYPAGSTKFYIFVINSQTVADVSVFNPLSKAKESPVPEVVTQ